MGQGKNNVGAGALAEEESRIGAGGRVGGRGCGQGAGAVFHKNIYWFCFLDRNK